MKDKDHEIHTPPRWYALRVTYSREMVVKRYCDANGIPSFVPLEYKTYTRNGVSVRKLLPVVHNLIFINSNRQTINELKWRFPIRYIMDKGTGRPITVPKKQMLHFMAVADKYDQQVVYLDPETLKAKIGTLVRVKEGVFKGGFNVKAPSSSHLKIKNNSVLDLYFELFVIETEYLLRRGLVKKYRKTEGSLNVLKGSLQFSKQISKNLVHKERFYTKHSTYDTEHLLHIILHKTLQLLGRINTNTVLAGRINALLLNFPEMPDQKITESVFDKLVFNRKTMGYQKAIEFARLILLHYYPDLNKGRDDVLALMFDMNALWEQFVLVSLRKNKDFKVRGQASRFFWKPEGGSKRSIKPDIIVSTKNKNYVLDTKWKLVSKKPSIEDLRQMYAYHHYFEAKKVALLYPGHTPYVIGKFVDVKEQKHLSDMECGLLYTQYKGSVKNWQKQIGEEIKHWINSPSHIESHE